jgi:predicted amino acid racemase
MLLTINLTKITDNARKTITLCRPFGLEVVGVTKGVCGLPAAAQAMLASGIKILGDSRLDNIARMRDAGIQSPIILLRSPAPSEVSRCITLADASLNADLNVIRALYEEAIARNKAHGVTLMVDFDTGREGFAPEEVSGACREILSLPGLKLNGLGVYFPFYSDGDLHLAAQQSLVSMAKKIEHDLNITLQVISGGSTNVFRTLILEGKQIFGVTQLRIGTAILLGISSSIGPRIITGLHHDTFVLDAELIEVKQRKSRLIGILALGQSDTESQFLFPTSSGVKILDASSDHMILDLTDLMQAPKVGDRITFRLGYYALNRLMLSPYVKIEYKD